MGVYVCVSCPGTQREVGERHTTSQSPTVMLGAAHMRVQPEPAATSRIGCWVLCCEAADARRRRLPQAVSCAAPNPTHTEEVVGSRAQKPGKARMRQVTSTSAMNHRRAHRALPARGHITLQPDHTTCQLFPGKVVWVYPSSRGRAIPTKHCWLRIRPQNRLQQTSEGHAHLLSSARSQKKGGMAQEGAHSLLAAAQSCKSSLAAL